MANLAGPSTVLELTKTFRRFAVAEAAKAFGKRDQGEAEILGEFRYEMLSSIPFGGQGDFSDRLGWFVFDDRFPSSRAS